MRHDDLDRILSGESEIVPSLGFVASVMDAVRRESVAPPPIPFPWKRAIPGLFAAGLALVSVLVLAVTLVIRGIATQPVPGVGLASAFRSILQGWRTVGANWIVLALVLSLASVKLSSRGSSPAKRDRGQPC
jgi:hypothetical protein